MKLSNYKLLCLFFLLFTLYFLSCSNNNQQINRDILDSKNQKFWDYYHSVNYCKRIDIFDSVYTFKFNILNNENLLFVEKYDITNNQLFVNVPNNFYGYIFNDILHKVDTVCCVESTFNGDFFGTWWIGGEIPPTFNKVDSLKNLVRLWKAKLNCEEKGNVPIR